MSYGSVAAEGGPRIVDRVGRRQLPVGIESFEDVLRSFTYVDKTLAAADLIDRRGVTLYCRPRRFGKSTFLRMLQCFFEVPVEGYVPDRRDLFKDLAIADADPRYMQDCGTHPVIYLELASCAMQTFEDTRDAIALQLSGEFSRHDYVYDSLRRGEVARFDRALAGELPAIAMELKVATEDGEAALGVCARDVALAQAQRLEYGHGLAGAGLVRWGVAFRGKHAACTCEHVG